MHHGLEELEHLVRLSQVQLVHQVGLQVRHDPVVQQEVQKVVLCLVDLQERLFQEDRQVDQWEHLCQGDHLEDRVQGDLLVHRDHLVQRLLIKVDLLVDLLLVDLLGHL